jgi:FkbM family methyltransferase
MALAGDGGGHKYSASSPPTIALTWMPQKRHLHKLQVGGTFVVGRIYHYAHAIETRLFQMFELSLMKRKGSPFGSQFRRQVWRVPTQTEDWVNIARFFDPNERLLLVDIGANVGDFTSAFLSIYKSARSVCFEPVGSTFERLGERFSGDARVESHRVALSDVEGISEIYLQDQSTLSSFAKYTSEANDLHRTEMVRTKSEETQTRRLDSFQLPNGHDRMFVKIDVQGFEIEVIRGAMQTLSLADAVLIECSFADEYEGKEPSFSPACALLRQCNLYPIVFQDYNRLLSNYAFERDVLFVRRELLSRIWFRNYPSS